MKNILFAGLVGGIILFVWGALAWTVLPLHSGSLHVMPNEEAVVSAMKAGLDKKGVYLFPGMPAHTGDAQLDKVAMDAWTAKYAAGPVGIVIYDPAGGAPTEMGQMVVGFIIGCLSALLAAWLLSRSTAASSSFLARVAFCGILGSSASGSSKFPSTSCRHPPESSERSMWASPGSSISRTPGSPSRRRCAVADMLLKIMVIRSL